LLVLTFALLFSGCDSIQRLFGEIYGVDDGQAGNGAGEGGSGPAGGGGGGGNAEPAPEEPGNAPNGYVAQGKPVPNAVNNPSIKAKFGVNATGTEGVTKAFLELSEFIRNGGLEDDLKYQKEFRVIQLGDWIDLEGGLAIAVNGGKEFSSGEDWDKEESWGKLNRLIVVGINSFQTKNDGAYTYPAGEKEGAPPLHVVFQFQNIPVSRRMTDDGKNTGGYPNSLMRKYLTPVEKESQSGYFLDGLKGAGVPEDVLWGPSRVMSTKGNGPKTINDLLWLPTEYEMFGELASYFVQDEEVHQARLEYYTNTSNNLRKKYDTSKKVNQYWLATADRVNTSSFCGVNIIGNVQTNVNAAVAKGVSPAFCVY
jgi:hypothetical protein